MLHRAGCLRGRGLSLARHQPSNGSGDESCTFLHIYTDVTLTTLCFE
jgi:hypothetical protein